MLQLANMLQLVTALSCHARYAHHDPDPVAPRVVLTDHGSQRVNLAVWEINQTRNTRDTGQNVKYHAQHSSTAATHLPAPITPTLITFIESSPLPPCCKRAGAAVHDAAGAKEERASCGADEAKRAAGRETCKSSCRSALVPANEGATNALTGWPMATSESPKARLPITAMLTQQ